MVNVPTRLFGYFISETTEWISLSLRVQHFMAVYYWGVSEGNWFETRNAICIVLNTSLFKYIATFT